MAVTKLSDLSIVTEVFLPSVVQNIIELNAFYASGVAVNDPALNAFLANPNGGKTISPRYHGPLPTDDANVSSDNDSATSTPKKVTGIENTAVRQSLNQSWSEMDLAATLYGVDPLRTLQGQIAGYWDVELQKRIVASIKGVIADNVANDSGDMVNDISGGSGAAGLFNAEAVLDAQATLGDRNAALNAIAMHSTVYFTARKLNLIDTMLDSENRPIQMYGGMRVVVDDELTVTTDTVPKYYTYLFGPGAIAIGMGAAKVPFEVDRTPASGNGGGQETLFSRMECVIHPQGFQCSLTASPTIAQLESALSWDRAFARKRIPLAVLISNG